MKAVIMAGGEGSRLRPLTCDRPKPMVPLMNKPTMEHIINLLKKHDIKDIAVTLQYMPEAIMDYFGDGKEFGVNLKYFVEEQPLGTAGSVKNGEKFLDETFLVISGDALTDFNLQEAINYHQAKKALATLILTNVDNPLEYGVIITKPSGEIARFLEKPSWGEVFSDTVNTGIYILEPEVLTYFPANTKYDFSQDLFPKLLANQKPLFGCVLDGYWCDIGNLEQYQQAHFDVLDGKVELSLAANQTAKGIWIEEGAEIHHQAAIEGPTYIAKGTKIAEAAKIGAYTVVGENNLIASRASIKRSVLWNNNFLGSDAQVRGTTLCHKVEVRNRSRLFEGVVIGDSTLIEEGALLKPGVRIWPYKRVESGATVNESLIWGLKTSKNLFGLQGIRGILNRDLTPEFATKLAVAYSSLNSQKVVVSCDSWPGSQVIKQSFLAGLQSAGVKVMDIGIGVTSINRFAVENFMAKGGIHIKQCPEDLEKVAIQFFNEKGANISKGEERKLENLMAREDFPRSKAIGEIEYISNVIPDYCNQVFAEGFGYIDFPQKVKILVGYQGKLMGELIKQIFAKADCEVVFSDYSAVSISQLDIKDIFDDFANEIRLGKVNLGVLFDNNGEHLTLFDEAGQPLADQQLVILNSLIAMEKNPGTQLTIPITASQVIEGLAPQYQCSVLRSKTAPQVLMDQMEKFQFKVFYDGIFNLATIISYLEKKELTLSKLIDEIPKTYLVHKEIYCPWEAKGKVIRQLIEEAHGQEIEMLDGVKVFHEGGWSLILPDSEKPVVKVYSESNSSFEEAKLLNEIYSQKIETLKV